MRTSILFKTKENIETDKKLLVELFFKDWVDQICEQQVVYKVERNAMTVDFEKQEDAVALRLRGLPPEFQDYLELIG